MNPFKIILKIVFQSQDQQNNIIHLALSIIWIYQPHQRRDSETLGGVCVCCLPWALSHIESLPEFYQFDLLALE